MVSLNLIVYNRRVVILIKIKGIPLDIDVLKELSEYHFDKHRIRGEKLQACSPFREERRPSFAVNLLTGVWIDSGGHDEEWRKGSFVKLLSFLRNETQEETEKYLLDKYNLSSFRDETLDLKMNLTLEASKPRVLSYEDLDQYNMVRHPYLKKRGISEKAQRAFKVGYCDKNDAITMPWFNKSGKIMNIKFRSVKSKAFWYMPGCVGVANLIYGLHFIYMLKSKVAYVVESEIDAMYLWSYGFPAIALGGANMSETQAKLILESPVELLILGTDSDAAGEKIKGSIIERMFGIIELREIKFPPGKKDWNELDASKLIQVANDLYDINLDVLVNPA
jgi:5S rRNA maturation endonuclease (ribonuclease M5)